MAKTSKTIVITSGLLVVFTLLSIPVQAQEDNWVSLTSFRNVRALKVIGNQLYAATQGGLQVFADNSTKPEKWLNTDGIGTSDFYDVMSDADGVIWIAGYGRLARIDHGLVNSYVMLDSDDRELTLYSLADDGDRIWIGTDFGLLLFSKENDGGQIQDSYTLFDNLTAEPAVFRIALNGDTIWIATSSGVAVADKSNPTQLKSPSSWRGYTSGGFYSDTVNAVALMNGTAYAASPRAVVRVDLAGNSLVPVAFGDIVSTNLEMINDSAYCFIRWADSSKYGILEADSLVELSPSLDPYVPFTAASFRGQLWLAGVDIGLFYPDGGEWKLTRMPGMSSNDVRSVSVFPDGPVMAGYGNRVVSYMRTDSIWNSYLLNRPPKFVMSDSSGLFLVGTDGSGVWAIESGKLSHYDRHNSTLFGNNDDTTLNFINVAGLENDGRYLYAACYRAANGYPVAIGDLNDLDNRDNWDSLGLEDGIQDIYVTCLDVHKSQLALGTAESGLYFCDLGDDPFDHSLRACTLYTTAFDRGDLVSNSVLAVEFDPDGNVWVGTSFGLSRWDPGFERFIEVTLPPGLGTDFADLEFDSRGNLWVGTSKGLARRDATTGELTHYTQRNSGLLSDNVTSLQFEAATGLLYIGTDRGISVRPSATSNPTSDVTEVIAFPNPFVIRSNADRMFFNFSRLGTVRLYTVAGELVRQIPVNLSWDGRNESGEEVASGVYLYLVEDEQGQFGRGKILLVRE